MKLAHFSDIHLTHFPLVLSEPFALKRLAAVASYTLMGRGRHFQGSDLRISRLLDDIALQGVEHSLCTGDLTGVSSQAEFSSVARLFGARLRQPELLTVIPGNHDRYLPSAQGLFEQHFATLSEGGRFPFMKQLGPEVSLVGIDVARPTSLIDSSGLCGRQQQDALLDILTDPSLKSRFVVLAMHYGLLRSKGQRDRRSHGLRDDLEVISLLDRDDVSLDLVLHGHMHRPYVTRTKRRILINAGSATDLGVEQGCGYHVYDIEPAAHRLRISRRVWNAEIQGYEALPASSLNREMSTR